MNDGPLIVTLGTTPTLARTMRFAALRIDGVNRTRDVREYASGKSINAARAAANLGARVRCLTVAGGGRGQALAQLLNSAGLPHRLIDVVGQTRMTITVVDDAAGTATELIEESSPLTLQEGEALTAACRELVDQTGVLVLSGSLAPGIDPSFYARCIGLATAAGCQTILDASGKPLRLAIDAKPAVVKINAGELAGIAENAGDVVVAAQQIAQPTGGWIVVTRGVQTTLAVHATEGAWSISVPAVERVVSPIGSGDSFAGGMAVALARGDAMLEAIRVGTACAAANVLSADAAHFDRADVERLLGDVHVSRLP